MTLTHRGRGGSVTRTAQLARIAAMALLGGALSIAGCGNKKSQSLEPVGGSQTGSDMTSKNTLDEFSKNGIIPGEGGPLSDIHFGYNDYTIQPQDSSVLKSNASWLQAHPNANVQIEGNCDERGSEEYNIALGAKRAQSAKDYLATLGISPGRMSTISYGKELPLCHESDESCWQRNRRDHFVVSGGGQASR